MWLSGNKPDYYRMRVWCLPLLSGLGSSVAVSCGVGHRGGLGPVLLWLWCRPAAVVLIRPLAWELPYATGAALKSKQNKTKIKNKTKKKKKPRVKFCDYFFLGKFTELCTIITLQFQKYFNHSRKTGWVLFQAFHILPSLQLLAIIKLHLALWIWMACTCQTGGIIQCVLSVSGSFSIREYL